MAELMEENNFESGFSEENESAAPVRQSVENDGGFSAESDADFPTGEGGIEEENSAFRHDNNPFDGEDDGRVAPMRRGIVTEPIVYERKLPQSSEKSATFETAETASPDGELSDSDYLAGAKPIIYYHLSEFDGPLDLLLALIKDAKIRIEDVFVSDVTRQYVEIIKNTPKEELDFEYAGEFITLAAELVYLKSLRTLPADDEDEEYVDDPELQRAALINKIKEYALMKEQSEKLRGMETINRFYRMPVYSEKDYRVCLTNFSLPKLVDAFARVLVNAEQRERSVIPKKVVQDRFSVADQMRHILELLTVYDSFTFSSLFEPDFDRNDIVTTFLAVLELLKYGRLRAEQEELFGEITLYAVEGADTTPVAFEEEEDGKY